MKTIMNTSLVLMAISTAGCAGFGQSASKLEGRVIEFTSGAEGFNTNTYFYEGAREVIAFDTQFTPALAKESIAHLRKFTNKPISWVVITHPNPDKFNGASVFKDEGARIVSSESTAEAIPGVHAYKEYYFVEMAKMFKKGEYPQPAVIDQTFSGEMDIVLQGGERIQLRELAQPGVSSTQTVAYIRSLKSLMVGDLVHHKAHAWLEGGIVDGKPVPSLTGWARNLDQLLELFPANTTVFGGRGVKASLSVAAAAQKKYLQTADRIVTEYVYQLGTGKSELQTEKAGGHYSEIQRRMETQFPDYQLGYMIQYGVYGLVNSK